MFAFQVAPRFGALFSSPRAEKQRSKRQRSDSRKRLSGGKRNPGRQLTSRGAGWRTACVERPEGDRADGGGRQRGKQIKTDPDHSASRVSRSGEEAFITCKQCPKRAMLAAWKSGKTRREKISAIF